MITAEIRQKYTPTIGIECHVQLKTLTKLFSSVPNDAREAAANTLISHIDLGMPGALPVLNEKAVEYAARLGFAVNTEPQKLSYFERKHYFYPDLPKGYQITQLASPIVVGGYIDVAVGLSISGTHADGVQGKAEQRTESYSQYGEGAEEALTQQSATNTSGVAGSAGQQAGMLRVRLNRIQIEEDAGKSTHPAGKDYSLVDLNRAGTPLLEIVSEADMHSAAEAKAYAKELYLLVRYADISDADMYHGNMRFDVNVSVSPDGSLGTRTETKNLNSFRSVEKAVEFEIERQIELLEKGQKIVQETRGWDDAKQKTLSQRTKEEAEDYRYFPEPDIPPIELSDDYLAKVKAELPVLPAEWRARLSSLGLDSRQTDTLLEAEIEHSDSEYLSLVEGALDQPETAKKIANWLVNVEIPAGGWKVDGGKKLAFYKALSELVDADKLSSTGAKSLLTQLLAQQTIPENLGQYAEEQGYIQVSDEAEIEKIVVEVLAENPQAAEDVKTGEAKAIGFLVGQVMKKSLGKANPVVASSLIKKHLQ